MKYKYLLFDLDGTITDSQLGITNSVMYALDKYNIKVKQRSELFKFVGPPLETSFMEYYHFTKPEAMQAVEYYREYFKDTGIFENEVYKGFEELLEALVTKGYILHVATSKPEVFAKRIMDHFGLSKYFTSVCGSTLDASRSKKGDVIAYALKENNITDLSKVLMIGDREHDVIGAKENNLDCLGVLYGYGSVEELQKAGATYIVKSVAEIKNMLCI